MEKEMVVPLISLVGSVAGAIFTWVQAIKTARLKAETDVALETMKVEQERRRMAFDVASKEMDPLEDALMRAWSDIQTVKDIVQKVVSPHRSNASVVLSALQNAVDSLVREYGQWGAALPELARDNWHDAKKHAALILTVVTEHSSDPNASPQVPQEFLIALQSTHSALTDCQLAISTSRQNLRQQSVKQILEML